MLNQKSSLHDLLLMYLGFFLAQSIVVYIANMIAPKQVVLGTHFYSPLHSLLQSVAIITVLIIAAVPMVELLAEQIRVKLTASYWFVITAVVNIAVIWFIARFAEMLGFGIASYMVAVVLGIVFSIVQGFLMMKVLNQMMN